MQGDLYLSEKASPCDRRIIHIVDDQDANKTLFYSNYGFRLTHCKAHRDLHGDAH
jgi:hypothetical protein